MYLNDWMLLKVFDFYNFLLICDNIQMQIHYISNLPNESRKQGQNDRRK
jgi:hypothetical protein